MSNKWLVVVALVLFVLTGAMGLRNIATANAGTVNVANGGGPIPPDAWSNGGGPIPPDAWSNGGGPIPPDAFRNGGGPIPPDARVN